MENVDIIKREPKHWLASPCCYWWSSPIAQVFRRAMLMIKADSKIKNSGSKWFVLATRYNFETGKLILLQTVFAMYTGPTPDACEGRSTHHQSNRWPNKNYIKGVRFVKGVIGVVSVIQWLWRALTLALCYQISHPSIWYSSDWNDSQFVSNSQLCHY